MSGDREGGSARFEAIVHGIVQGVFFRYSTKKEADRLGIRGTVQNWPDGTVHVDASGDPERLKEFLTWLHAGPAHAVVEQVDVAWHADPAPGEGFRILS